MAQSESRRGLSIREFIAWLTRKHAARHGWTVVGLTLATGAAIYALLLGVATVAIYKLLQ